MDNNILSEEVVRSYLDKGLDLRFMLFESVGSTNLLMKQYCDMQEGLIVAATQQTDGRGRLGRSFYSPAGSGLYVSILLKPEGSNADATMLTALSAVAVCNTIEQLTDAKPGIKWVNDIQIGGKKVCGILAQGAITADGEQAYVIAGIGVNLYPPKQGFPEEIKEIAGTVYKKGCNENSLFLATLLNNFFRLYKNFNASMIAKEYKERSIVIGKDITVLQAGGTYNAHVEDIDESCNLILRDENGRPVKLQSGEVSIRL